MDFIYHFCLFDEVTASFPATLSLILNISDSVNLKYNYQVILVRVCWRAFPCQQFHFSCLFSERIKKEFTLILFLDALNIKLRC